MSGDLITYRPSDTPIHRLHPLTKFLLVGCSVLGAYLAPVPVLAALLAAVFTAAIVAGVVSDVCWAAIPILAPLGAGLLVVHGLFTRAGGTPLIRLGPVTVWREGVVHAVTFFGVLAAFVLVGLVFVTTTHPKKLMVGLTSVGLPRKLGYVFVASLQLVPDLQCRARRIVDAQRSRGLDTGGSVRKRLRALIALLSPLLIGALISAQTRSLALEARGFSINGPRSSVYDLTTTPVDHILRLAGLGFVVALVGWRLT